MSQGAATDRSCRFPGNRLQQQARRLWRQLRGPSASVRRRQSWLVGTDSVVSETLEIRSLLSALSVSIVPGSISENGGSAVGTVTRSEGGTALPLTVTLTSSDTSEVTVPASVVIQAGQASANFVITAVDDSLLDGTQTAVITATATDSADGTLDTTWGTNGYAALPNYRQNLDPSFLHIARQPDGKVVVAGRHPTLDNAWNVIRLTTDGAYDTTFGTNGTVTSSFGADVFPQGISIAPDGQILVVGRGVGSANHVVARYSATGVQNLTVGPSNAIFGNDIVADSSGDGGFYVGGGIADDFAVLRYRANGTLDTDYGTSGVARFTLPATTEVAWSMVQQADRKIVVAGSALGGDFGAVRFNTNGTPDTSFSGDGFQSVNFGASEFAQSVALAPDGRIVLVGSTNSRDDWAVARLLQNGALDTSFSGDGKDILNWGASEEARSVVVQPDGRILVGGAAFRYGYGREMAVVRYNVDGTLDTTFDSDGKKVLPSQPSVFEETRGLALQADGNLLALGGYASQFMVFRLLTATQSTPGSATIHVTDSESLLVSASPATISENNGLSTGTVTRSNTDTSSPLTVTLASSDVTAAIVPATITIPAGQRSVTFTITGVDDAVIDGNQSVTISATAALYNGGGTTLTVTDDDQPRLTLAVTTANPSAPAFNESDGQNAATLTISRTGSTAESVVVSLVSNDTTEAVVTSSAVIPAGASSVSVPIDAVDDFIIDGTRTVTFTATAAGHVTGSAAAFVEDNDFAGLIITPTTGLVTTEAGGTASFTVVVTSQPKVEIAINFRSSDLSEGSLSASTLKFTPFNWNVPQTITITGVDDEIDDGDVNYAIITSAIHSNDTSFNGIDPPDIFVRNLDDDSPELSLTLSGPSLSESGSPGTLTGTVTLNYLAGNPVIVNLSTSDSSEATVPLSVTIPGDATSATFTISVADDLLVDGTQLVSIAASADGHQSANAVLSVLDNDLAGFSLSATSLTVHESGTSASFDVTLTAAPLTDVVLTVSSNDPGETSVAPQTLTFTTASWNVPQTVTVTGIDDDVDDDNQTSVITVSVLDESSDNAFDSLADKSVVVSTIDNDTAGTTVSPTTGLLVIEGGQTDSVEIVLNTQPTADVTIDLVNPVPDQVTFSTYQFVFTPQNWNVPQTVVITAIDNFVAEGAFGIAVLPQPAISADPKYNGLRSTGTNGSILDDDFVGVSVSDVTRNTSESGQTATFTVVLRSEPTGTVEIPIGSNAPTEGTTSVSSLIFTPANWNEPQTVTLTGADDAVVDGDRLYDIGVGPIAGSSDYAGVDPDDPSLRNLDNDVLALSLTLAAGSISEAGGSTTATLSRNDGDLSQSLTVSLSSSDTSEATVPATVTIPAGQAAVTFPVSGVDDAAVDGPQSVSISATVSRYLAAAASLIVTDNDIANAAPEFTSLTNSSQTTSQRRPGEVITVTADFTDVNLADVHTATIDWGDGTTTSGAVSQLNGAGTVTGSRSYQQPGVYIVTVTLNDGAGGVATRSTAAAVTGARLVNGVLIVVGTNLNDKVSVSTSGKANLRVQAGFLGGKGRLDFKLASITRMEIWLNAGNDSVSVAGNIRLPVAVVGGSGFDTVSGPLVLLDSTVAEGAVSNQSLPLSIPRLPASSVDSVFASLIDSDRDHWFWSV